MKLMNSLLEIEKEIRNHTTPEERIINGLWSIDCLFNPNHNGRIFNCKFLLAQTTGLGCAYGVHDEYSRSVLASYINRDFLSQEIDDIALKVCLFDSIYGRVNSVKSAASIELSGTANYKMHQRTEIIIQEAERIIGQLEGKHILNVGVVGDILTSFSKKGAVVCGTDFDPAIIGTKAFGDIRVYDGKKTIELIGEADIAIVTGMTITTQTIDSIIQTCKNRKVPIIVFAETGANLAGYYVRNGVDVYLSEHFPFYIFNGDSIIEVYRK